MELNESHATSFIRQGSIFFVPILRTRLSFALLVRRTAEWIGLSSGDAVAVGLPPSLCDELHRAILKFPIIQQISLQVSNHSEREVLAVTPADGLVEACRLALEREPAVPLFFLDREVDPGHLADRRCEALPNWPDDRLALDRGVHWYLELIQHYLREPPMRLMPLDSWRERHMAECLRRLAPRYRRILAVVDAANLEGIQRYLAKPSREEIDAAPALRLRVSCQRPAPEALLAYLDDIPFIVEMFERSRLRAEPFVPQTALLEAVDEVVREAEDLALSPRRFVAFAHLLDNMRAYRPSVGLKLGSVLRAAGASFGESFALRLRPRLLRFRDQVPTERVGSASHDAPDESPAHKGFVYRSCHPGRTVWHVRDRDADVANHPTGAGWDATWPPWVWHVMDMIAKLQRIANASDTTTVARLFEGSLRAGLDVRRTLRSYYQRDPKLWVKVRKRTKAIGWNASLPVVWIFEHPTQWSGEPKLIEDFNAVAGEDEEFTYAYRYDSEQRDVRSSSGLKVWYRKAIGMVNFADMRLTTKQLRATLGDERRARVPLHGSTRELASEGDWAGTLIAAALQFAESSVTCVVPDGWNVPSSIREQARSLGKEIHELSLAAFTAEERRRLTTVYYLQNFEVELPDDSNDPAFNRRLVEHYEVAMKEFWW